MVITVANQVTNLSSSLIPECFLFLFIKQKKKTAAKKQRKIDSTAKEVTQKRVSERAGREEDDELHSLDAANERQ